MKKTESKMTEGERAWIERHEVWQENLSNSKSEN